MSNIAKEGFNELSNEPGLDYERLFIEKTGCETIPMAEFYRKAALTFRLRKPEARVLLRRLLERGLATQEGRTINFKMEGSLF